MPLLIVPGHHDSPKSLKNIFEKGYSFSSPSEKNFINREGEWTIGSWIIVASVNALNRILTSPEHDFRGYSFEIEQQLLSTDSVEDDDRDFSERMLDYKDPSCKNFWKSQTNWCSGITLVNSDSQYSDCMRALIDLMWDLPIIPVLQAYIFDPKFFDKLSFGNDSEIELNQDMLSNNYPYGMLAYPKRIWPEFYHAQTWKSILRISHHPDKDNSPHGNAFSTDPRLWSIEEDDDINTITEKIKAMLMPIINAKIEEINQSHIRC